MVFSSFPAYLDPPNWQIQQQQNQQILENGNGNSNPCDFLPLPPPPPPPPSGTGSDSGSVKPVSMTDRARLAKLPQPEATLKCPRCESTNTKFCYFNNYNLSQPRHFCKTCRRYWTRGGALRNVPVGGGCRRNNKRSKSNNNNRSKSPATTSEVNSNYNIVSSSASKNILGHLQTTTLPHLPFCPPLNHLGHGFSGIGDQIGLNFGDSSNSQFRSGNLSSCIGLGDLHQYHFMVNNLEHPPAPSELLYQFESNNHQSVEPLGGAGSSLGTNNIIKSPSADSGVISHIANVKMEENNQGLNLSRNFFGALQGNSGHQYLRDGNNGFADMSGSNSSYRL